MASKAKKKKTRRKNSSTDPATDYANDVVSGQIVAGPHVRNACQRHLNDIESGHERGLVWDIESADRAIRFFRTVLTVEVEHQDEDGNHVSEAVPFELHSSQCFIVGSLFGWKKENGLRRFRRAYIEVGKGNGKALALDTPIPTPTGWTTMGALAAGDMVIGADGKPCRVVQAHPVSVDRDCFEVEFDDGESIVASAEHLWKTEHRRPKPGGVSAKSTAQIAATLRNSNGNYQSANHSVSLCAALDLPEADLPVPPYVLGAWLGDGDTDCARITCAYEDIQVIEEIKAEGQPVIQQKRHSETTGRFALSGGRGRRGGTLQERLRGLGVLGDKHIPGLYLRASAVQRLSLLQGLMDTDGCIASSGQCEFTATKYALAQGVLELALSLGLKATLREGSAKLDGRRVGAKYRVGFFASWDVPVFRLKRKADRQAPTHARRRLSADRRIVSCTPVPSVPVRCITVDAPDSMFLCGRAMVPTHNSPLAAGLGHYMLTATGKLRAECYSAATDKDQAAICFRDAVEMWRRSPNLRRRLHPSGQNPVWQLSYNERAGFFKPISSEKKGKSGIRPYFAAVDEIHEHSDNSVVEMLRAGTKGNQEALIFEITNSGSSRESVCWSEHEYTIKVCSGEAVNDSWFGYVCALDEDDDPFEDESCWPKANPLLGVSIQPDFIREQVVEAQGMQGKESLVKRLHFCQWTDGTDGWISSSLWDQVEQDLHIDEYAGEVCYAGLDLSFTRDLSALALVFPEGDAFDAFMYFWKAKEGIAEASKRDRVPYDLWANNGHLLTTPGSVIKLGPIAQKLGEIQDRFDLQNVAYDRYRYKDLEESMIDLGVEVPMTEHPQGFRRVKSSALWMPGSFQLLENAIIEKRAKVNRNPVMRWNVAVCSVRDDPAGTDNQIPDKKKSTGRIDGVTALSMAVGITYQRPEEGPDLDAFLNDTLMASL